MIHFEQFTVEYFLFITQVFYYKTHIMACASFQKYSNFKFSYVKPIVYDYVGF